MYKFLSKLYFSLDSLVKIKSNTSGDIIIEGEKKTNRMKYLIIIIATALTYYGIIKCSPNYGFYREVKQWVNKSSTLVSDKKSASASASASASEFDSIGRHNLKMGMAIFLFIIFYAHIALADKTKNSKLLRLLSKNNKNFTRLQNFFYGPLINDIINYAKVMPSHRTSNSMCNGCKYSHDLCDNSLSGDEFFDKYSFHFWKKIYNNPNADAGLLKELVEATLRCKLVLYARVAAMDMLYILIASWLVHRIVELVILNGSYDFISETVVVIFFALAILLILGWLNKSYLNNGSTQYNGVWAHLNEISEIYFKSETNRKYFEKIYQEDVCGRGRATYNYEPRQAGGRDINLIDNILYVKTLKHIDEIILRKLSCIANADVDASNYTHYMCNIIVGCTKSFFESIFDGSGNGNINVDYLMNTSEVKNYINDFGVIKNDISGGGVFCRGEHEIYGGAAYKLGIKSLFIYPIKFSYDDIRFINSKICADYNFMDLFENSFGYLVMSSTSKKIFTFESKNTIKKLVKPFAMRICFEMSRNKIKEIRS